MRLIARTEFEYRLRLFKAGDIFDTPSDAEGLELINQDKAKPFNLEDPATTPAITFEVAPSESKQPSGPPWDETIPASHGPGHAGKK